MANIRANRPDREKPAARRTRRAPGASPPRPPTGGQAFPAGRRPPPRRRRRRSGKRTLHYLLLLIIVLPAGAILFLTVLFQIENITVTGLDRYSPDEVIAVSGIALGENLLRLSTGRIEAEILEAFTYISGVVVSRRFPHSVEITVTQYQPELAAKCGDGLALLTLDGKMLERGLSRSPGIPIVRGLRLEDYQPGDRVNGPQSGDNAERLVMVQYLLDAAQATDFLPITDIDVRDRLNMRVVHESRLLLELGSEADLEYKLTFLHHVIVNNVDPGTQARLDISNARERRLVLREGRVIDGEFIPGDIAVPFIFPGYAQEENG